MNQVGNGGKMKRTIMKTGLALVCLVAGDGLSLAADQALFNFDANFDLARVQTSDARVTWIATSGGAALGIRTGHSQTWPGVTMPAPTGHWDLSAFARLKSVCETPARTGSRCIVAWTILAPTARRIA